MTRLAYIILAAFALAGCGREEGAPEVPAEVKAPAEPVVGEVVLASGIAVENMDPSVAPGDDFHRYVNGTWLETVAIPPDQTRWGSFVELKVNNEKRLKTVMEEAMGAADAEAGSDMARLRDFFRSYMDTDRIEAEGIEALHDELAAIDAATSREDLTRLVARMMVLQVGAPLKHHVDPDSGDTSRYILYLRQGGLGLPDRDYYLKEGEKFDKIRAAYRHYVETLLGLSGVEDAAAGAETVMGIEQAFAEAHWPAEKSRDRDARYNKYDVDGLAGLMQGFDVRLLLDAADLSGQQEFVVWQPEFFSAFARMFVERTVSDWQTYLRFKLVDSVAYQLGEPFFQARFDMFQKALRDVETPRERWQYALDSADEVLGEVLSKVYLDRYFPPAAHQRMVELVDNLKAAFHDAIGGLEWMSDETKAEARRKLAALEVYVGYPGYWKDYSGLEIRPADLVGNMLRGRETAYRQEIDRLDDEIHRGEFALTTQSINAYYYPEYSEIVFLAGILQPPFFDMHADDAVNYGAIGAVIGHELSHAFDDQGRKVDEKGNLRDWWTAEDAAEYEARAAKLVEQFDQYEPIEGLHVNGRLTLGENIADLAGVRMAYDAYLKSLDGGEAPVIDDFTGRERFFIGYGQAWRAKYREGLLRELVLSDPHSPPRYRVNGIVPNLESWYQTFGVTAENALYIAPAERVKIW